jgi:5-methylcytosine-specific restriction endonuclease McrA
MNTKICTKCKVEKELNEFDKDKSQKSGHKARCKSCLKLGRLENREEISKRNAKYRFNNKEKISKQAKKYRLKNKRKIAEQRAEHYKRNKKRLLQKQTLYYENNREDRLKFQENYRKNNREEINAKRKIYDQTAQGKALYAKKHHKRRHLEKQSEASLTDGQWSAILGLQQYQCACCGEFFDRVDPTRDHIIPVTKGGGLTFLNTQALCRSCNSRKNNKMIDYRTDNHKTTIGVPISGN